MGKKTGVKHGGCCGFCKTNSCSRDEIDFLDATVGNSFSKFSTMWWREGNVSTPVLSLALYFHSIASKRQSKIMEICIIKPSKEIEVHVY